MLDLELISLIHSRAQNFGDGDHDSSYNVPVSHGSKIKAKLSPKNTVVALLKDANLWGIVHNSYFVDYRRLRLMKAVVLGILCDFSHSVLDSRASNRELTGIRVLALHARFIYLLLMPS